MRCISLVASTVVTSENVNSNMMYPFCLVIKNSSTISGANTAFFIFYFCKIIVKVLIWFCQGCNVSHNICI